jgi:hypothetical protein
MKRWHVGADSIAPFPGPAVAVRLLRRWAAARAAAEPRLPSLVALGRELGIPAQAALALASVFELTESCLERPLEAECCCSPRLTADERAILLLLASRSLPAPPYASHTMPHGLPAALAWAVGSARHLLDWEEDGPAASGRACPFDSAPPAHPPLAEVER